MHFLRPLPLFETNVKEGNFHSRVSVGTLSVLDQNSPGCESLAESEGKAAFAWLTTFSNTWIGSLSPKATPASDEAVSNPLSENSSVLNQARPSNLVGQLNSAGKSRGTEETHRGTLSSSGIKLKPLGMLVQKEVRPLQPGFEVAGEMTCGQVDASQSESPPSNWAPVKLMDFLRYNPSGKAFWGSSFVLLVMSGVEISTLTSEKAAKILGVKTMELELEMRKVKNKEKTWNPRGSLSTNTLLSIKSERCVSKLGDIADDWDDWDHDYSSKERGVKRKASSWVNWRDDKEWITGKVVSHLLKRSFAMKDQFFSVDDGKPPVFVLRMSWPFYESNVMRVAKEIDEYCGFAELIMESREVQDLLKAARNLDRQQMEGGGYALAPSYNYSRCMLEEKADYWEIGLPALLLRDVSKGVMPAEIAACQLGVTTTMIRSAIARKRLWATQGFRSGPVTVQRYKECGFGGEEDFWKESTTTEELKKVYKYS